MNSVLANEYGTTGRYLKNRPPPSSSRRASGLHADGGIGGTWFRIPKFRSPRDLGEPSIRGIDEQGG